MISSLLAVCILAPCVAADQAAKKYTVKQGMIQYQISGLENGTETLWWEDYGKKEARERVTEVKMMGMTTKTSRKTIMDESFIYVVDNKEKTVVKTSLESASPFAGKQMSKEFGEEFILANGGKKTGTEKVLGKKCEIWELPKLGSRIWVWEGIPLKTTVNLGVEVTTEAVELDTDKPDEEVFVYPKSYKLIVPPAY